MIVTDKTISLRAAKATRTNESEQKLSNNAMVARALRTLVPLRFLFPPRSKSMTVKNVESWVGFIMVNVATAVVSLALKYSSN